MQLKNTEKLDKEIEQSRQADDYSYYRGKAELVLDMYKDQLNSLAFKRSRMKKEARGSVFVIAAWLVTTIVLFVASNVVIILLLPAVIMAFGGLILLPAFISSAVKKNIEYALMMEKLGIIKKRNGNTFMDEDRFIKNKIAEYEEAFLRLELADTVTEDDIKVLEKMSVSEEFHSQAEKYEFHLWPFFALMICWVVMALFIWGM